MHKIVFGPSQLLGVLGNGHFNLIIYFMVEKLHDPVVLHAVIVNKYRCRRGEILYFSNSSMPRFKENVFFLSFVPKIRYNLGPVWSELGCFRY